MPPKDSATILSKLIGASGWMMFVKLLGAASGYALAWLVTQQEGAAAYGRFELGLTVLAMGALAARVGLDGVMVKWLAASHARGLHGIQRSLVFRAMAVTLLVGMGLSWLVMAGQEVLIHWSGDAETKEVWPWVAAGIPVLALWGLSAEMLRGLSRMKQYALSQQGLLTALAVGVLWATSLGVLKSYAWAVGIAMTLSVVMLLASLSWRKGSASNWDESEWGWKSMFSTGWPMLMGSAMYLVMSWSDTLLVAHYLEEDQVGVYRLTFKLAAVVTLVQAAVNSYAAPLFAERHAVGDKEGVRAALRTATLLNVAFSIPAFVAIVLLGPVLLRWFGEEFVSGTACLHWLALGQLSMTLCGPVMYVLNMTGYERIGNRILWTTALINVAINVYAIPRMGIVGAAVATALSLVIWNVAAAWAVQQKLGLSVWRDLWNAGKRRR